MKNTFILKLSAKIILVFGVVFFMSFIPDACHSLFGDWLCKGSKWVDGNIVGCRHVGSSAHDPEWHWGYRHYVWFLMGLSLFIVQVVQTINMIENESKKNKTANS